MERNLSGIEHRFYHNKIDFFFKLGIRSRTY